MGSDSEDMQPESEENDSTSLNPFPLEDKYIDEADRQRYVAPSTPSIPYLTHLQS